MTGVRIELRDTDEPLQRLAGMIARLDNPSGLFDNIGSYLVGSTQRRFERGAAPGGSVWPPSLRALAEGGKTLIKSAQLMGSITHVASASGVEVGSNKVYAAIHQLGGEIKQDARTAVLHFKRNKRTGASRFAKANSKATFAQKAEIGARVIKMPARPFLGLDDDDNRAIIGIAETFVAGEVRP